MTDNTDIGGYTCYPIKEVCPLCGYAMASNGRLDWCENDEVCGYCRKSIEAPLDRDEDAEFAGEGLA